MVPERKRDCYRLSRNGSANIEAIAVANVKLM
jgi:hypothetical protein